MGVTCAVSLREGRMADLATAIRDRISNVHDGRQAGKWSVLCRVFLPVGEEAPADSGVRKGRRLMVMQSGSDAGRMYAMVDGTVVVETEPAFEAIVSRAKTSWAPRIGLMIQGSVFEMDKFLVRLGVVVIASENRGIVLEVESTSSSHSLDVGWDAATALATSLLGSLRGTSADRIKAQLAKPAFEACGLSATENSDLHSAFTLLRAVSSFL
ncbi:hypothetical protein DFJ74DRAFT_706829 [Hyaloraphidium curvatum]|nr:hypothetical protein DFJ74DRAFT_706829 [Hyaloraphidium curvatum]